MALLIYTNSYDDGKDIFSRFPFSGQMKTAIDKIKDKNDAELAQHVIDYFNEIIASAPCVNAGFAMLQTGVAAVQMLSEDDIDDGADSIVALDKYLKERGYDVCTYDKKA